MFFDMVLRHWFFSLICLVLAGRIAYRFENMVIRRNQWYLMQTQSVCAWPPPFSWFGFLVLLLLPWCMITLTAPIFWVVLVFVDAKEKKRIKEEEQVRLEEERAERDRVAQENHLRAENRMVWFFKNKPTLYYNTIDGITVVLRPAAYAAAQEVTKRNRRDGLWEKDNVLRPAPETIVFATKQGRDLISVNASSSAQKVAGWISDLDEIVAAYGAELVRKEDIFVPWINATLISFAEQEDVLSAWTIEQARCELLDKQAPEILQPVQS